MTTAVAGVAGPHRVEWDVDAGIDGQISRPWYSLTDVVGAVWRQSGAIDLAMILTLVPKKKHHKS